MLREPGDVLASEQSGGLPSGWPPLVLVVMAVIGNAILMGSGAHSNISSIMPVVILKQIFSAALWVGAVWLGILLAYRAIVRGRKYTAAG